MKKMIAFYITVVMVLSCVQMVSFAWVENNILVNPSFTQGTFGWNVGSPTQISASTDAYDGDDAAMLIKKRGSNPWVSAQQHITQAIRDSGSGRYKASCYLKGRGTYMPNLALMIKIVNTDGSAVYKGSSYKTLTNTYQYFEVDFYLDTTQLSYVEFYWYSTQTAEYDFLTDACRLERIGEYPSLGNNLLVNASFENQTAYWSSASPTQISVSTNAYDSDNAAMLIKKRGQNQWVSVKQNVTQAMKEAGSGWYKASCYLKGSGTYMPNLALVIKIVASDGSASYKSSNYKTLTNAYQYFEVNFFLYTDEISYVEFYWNGTTTNEYDFIVDACSLVHTVDYASLPVPDPSIQRPERTSIGAIRWDAYFATSQNPSSYSVADQVARTLSYYPYQAPYYARPRTPVSGDVSLKIPSVYALTGKTYEIDDVTSSTLASKTIQYDYGVAWEEEAAYALNAGIDYFAYLWYKSADKMSLPRKAHVAVNGYVSGEQLKMCAILERGHFGNAVDISSFSTSQEKLAAIPVEHKELYQAMAQDSYLTVMSATGPRPIVYFYDAMNFLTENELQYILNEAIFYTAYLHQLNPQKYRAIQDLYCVAMDGSTLGRSLVDGYRSQGLDALSRYSVSYSISESERATANSSGSSIMAESLNRYAYNDLSCASSIPGTAYSNSFAQLLQKNYSYNQSYAAYEQQIQCIPLATAGRYQLPRIKTGVSWTGDYNWQYTRKGTPAEIAQGVSQTLTWVKENPEATAANTILIYGWNEHDEGGYLCPTLKFDANGNLLVDESGTPIADTSVLDAVKGAIEAYRVTELEEE